MVLAGTQCSSGLRYEGCLDVLVEGENACKAPKAVHVSKIHVMIVAASKPSFNLQGVLLSNCIHP